MSEEQCCCFCLNLRSGSYMSAGYSIALGIIGMIPLIILGVAAPTHPLGIMAWVLAVIYLLWVIFAIILIVGVQKSSRGYLIPWIVITIILTVLLAISCILNLLNAAAVFSEARTAVTFIISLAVLIINIYALWCVISLYRKNMNP